MRYLFLSVVIFIYVIIQVSKGMKIKTPEVEEEYPEAFEPDGSEICIGKRLYYKTPWKCSG
jgi:hypothetical protein